MVVILLSLVVTVGLDQRTYSYNTKTTEWLH